MDIKAQIKNISEATRTFTADKIIGLTLVVFVKPAMEYWRGEVEKHSSTMRKYPIGSHMHEAASAAHQTAFAEWHKLSVLSNKIAEAKTFKSFALKEVAKAA